MWYPSARRNAGPRLALAALATMAACRDEPTPPATPPVTATTPLLARAGDRAPSISGVSPARGTIRIDSSAAFTVTVHNAGGSTVPSVAIASEIVQGEVHRAAGAAPVECRGARGFLPPGNCATPVVVPADGAAGESGLLVPGSAALVLTLVQVPSGGIVPGAQPPVVLDADTIGITLLPARYIRSLVIEDPIVLETLPAARYHVGLSNPTGGSISNVSLQGVLVQGAASSGAGGTEVQCGGADIGVLPATGCTMEFTITATNVERPQTLVPGPATFVLILYRFDPATETTTELDRRSFPVLILPPHPYIASLAITESPVLFGGPGLPYTVTLVNPTGATISSVDLQGYLSQGSTASRAAGGTSVSCGQGLGVLPPGTCTMSFTINANNHGSGFGTLVPGPATFTLWLLRDPGAQPTYYSQRSAAVTLTNPVLQ